MRFAVSIAKKKQANVYTHKLPRPQRFLIVDTHLISGGRRPDRLPLVLIPHNHVGWPRPIRFHANKNVKITMISINITFVLKIVFLSDFS